MDHSIELLEADRFSLYIVKDQIQDQNLQKTLLMAFKPLQKSQSLSLSLTVCRVLYASFRQRYDCCSRLPLPRMIFSIVTLKREQDNPGYVSPTSKLLIAHENLFPKQFDDISIPLVYKKTGKSLVEEISPKKSPYSLETNGARMLIHTVPCCEAFVEKENSRKIQIQRYNSYSIPVSGLVSGQVAANFVSDYAFEDNGVRRKTCCKCKKSHCLKLYCECFAAKRICEGCSCVECRNRPEFYEARENAIQSIEEKNSKAFVPKFVRDEGPSSLKHSRGCNCKKSHCLKKYCECYQSGIQCTSKCKCACCHNRGVNQTSSKPVSPINKRTRAGRKKPRYHNDSMSILSN